MTALVKKGRRAGIVWGEITADGSASVGAAGFANIAENKAMRVDSLFRLYSQTRLITTTAVMTLIENGQLSLDAPVSDFIPEFADTPVLTGIGTDGSLLLEPQKTPLNVRHVLTYTAGLGYFYPQELGLAYDEVLSPNRDVASGMRRLAQVPLLDQPGSRWRYGYSGDLLGVIAEIVTGQRLDVFLERALFTPLAMTSTGFWADAENRERLTRIYGPTGDGIGWTDITQSALQLGSWESDGPEKSGGGGLLSTAGDYLRFCRMLLLGGELDGTRILRPETVDEMLSRQTTAEQGLVFEELGSEGMNPGYAWGYGVGVRAAEGEHAAPGAEGDAAWYGMADTHFVIDRVNGRAAVALAQYFGPLGTELQRAFRHAVFPAS